MFTLWLPEDSAAVGKHLMDQIGVKGGKRAGSKAVERKSMNGTGHQDITRPAKMDTALSTLDLLALDGFPSTRTEKFHCQPQT